MRSTASDVAWYDAQMEVLMDKFQNLMIGKSNVDIDDEKAFVELQLEPLFLSFMIVSKKGMINFFY